MNAFIDAKNITSGVHIFEVAAEDQPTLGISE